MKTDKLLKRFDGFVATAYCRVETVSLADGVRLLTPVPQKAGSYVFLGDIKTFRRLFEDKNLISRSTYLVCKGSEPGLLIPKSFDMDVNIIILNLIVREAIQYLNLVQADTVKKDPDGEQVLRAFFKSISVQNISSGEMMVSWAARFPYPLKTFLACIVIHPEANGQKLPFPGEISDALHRFFPETNLFYLNREWIVFYGQEELASEEINISYEGFSKLLQKYSLNAGISYVGVIPENLYTLYLTARMSMMLGTRISIPPRMKRIYSFAQYHPLYLIHLCAKEYDRTHNHSTFYYMAHPDVVRIFLYDQDHDTDLLDTLYAFMINQSSLSKTAQYLFMHRNTVYNRLTKIEGIIGYPLSKIKDYSIFVLSYMVVKYYCDYQSNELV